MSPLAAATLLAWSALCAADQRALGGRQLHQPLVAAVVAGALLGDVERGLLLGLWFQLVWILLLPVGGVILPDTASAAVAAAILAARVPGVLGLGAGIVGGLAIGAASVPWEHALRRGNARREARALESGRFGGAILHGLLGPAARGALCAGLALGAAVPLRALAPRLSSSTETEVALASALFGGAALTGLTRVAWHTSTELGGRGWAWILLGFCGGLAARWVLAGRAPW
jgi:hypothetical protein